MKPNPALKDVPPTPVCAETSYCSSLLKRCKEKYRAKAKWY